MNPQKVLGSRVLFSSSATTWGLRAAPSCQVTSWPWVLPALDLLTLPNFRLVSLTQPGYFNPVDESETQGSMACFPGECLSWPSDVRQGSQHYTDHLALENGQSKLPHLVQPPTSVPNSPDSP